MLRRKQPWCKKINVKGVRGSARWALKQGGFSKLLDITLQHMI
jgi:hypothetical protein